MERNSRVLLGIKESRHGTECHPLPHRESECQEIGRVLADAPSCPSVPASIEGQVTVLTLAGISDSFIITLTSTASDLLVFSSRGSRLSHVAFPLAFPFFSSGPA